MAEDSVTYVREQLKPSDVIEESKQTIYDLIFEAKMHALQEGIIANTILINKNMVKTNPFVWDGRIIPQMFCGMNIYWTKNDLPDNYSFAIFDAPTNREDRLAQFEAIGMEPDELKKAAELYNIMKEKIND